MYETSEITRNREIEELNPTWTPLAQVYCGSVWERQWSNEENSIFTDYVVYLGVKNKPPAAEKFGFKRNGKRSAYRRAFRFGSLEGALIFGEIHAIELEEE